ncbi:MAG: segregation/condensation protein A [Deltaproteobacteria bacterium]|nr:segregation/condensation protein A [Deltaproteobacteria bacterium]
MEHTETRMDALNLFPNPENPLEIKIPLFEGPLDLLLHLIRKKEVSIAEVRLSELTSSYLSYLEMMQSVNLDIAGEFLEIAATLILIKSRQLLPKPIEEIDEEEVENPEEILRMRLLEYQRFKDAAFEIGSRDVLWRDIFTRPETEEFVSDENEKNPEFEDVSVFALMEAFQQVMARRPKITRHVVETESLRIEDRIDQMIQLFNQRPRILFEDLFENIDQRSWLILTFMSLLEMVKIRLITLIQLEHLGPIHCTIHEDFQGNLKSWYELQEKEEPVENAGLRLVS